MQDIAIGPPGAGQGDQAADAFTKINANTAESRPVIESATFEDKGALTVRDQSTAEALSQLTTQQAAAFVAWQHLHQAKDDGGADVTYGYSQVRAAATTAGATVGQYLIAAATGDGASSPSGIAYVGSTGGNVFFAPWTSGAMNLGWTTRLWAQVFTQAATASASGSAGVPTAVSSTVNAVSLTIGDSADPSLVAYNENAAAPPAKGVARIAAAAPAGTGFDLLTCASDAGADDKFRVRGDGTLFADNAVLQSPADYAEWFATVDGADIPTGTPVRVVRGRVEAVEPDAPLPRRAAIRGVVVPRSGVTSLQGNAADLHWHAKFLRDDWGDYLLEPYAVLAWEEVTPAVMGRDAKGRQIVLETESRVRRHCVEGEEDPPAGAAVRRLTEDEQGRPLLRRVLNPDFDPARPYTPRRERPGWVLVALVGQVRIRAGAARHPDWAEGRPAPEGAPYECVVI